MVKKIGNIIVICYHWYCTWNLCYFESVSMISEDMALISDTQNWTGWETFNLYMFTNSCASEKTGEVLLYCFWGIYLFCKLYCTIRTTVRPYHRFVSVCNDMLQRCEICKKSDVQDWWLFCCVRFFMSFAICRSLQSKVASCFIMSLNSQQINHHNHNHQLHHSNLKFSGLVSLIPGQIFEQIFLHPCWRTTLWESK